MNNNLLRQLMIVTIIMTLVVLILWVLTRPQILTFASRPQDKPDFVFEDPIITEHYKGDEIWQIKASRGEFYKRKNVAFVYSISATMNSRDGSDITLSAPRGTIDLRSRDIVFYNSIVIQKDFRLTADELSWSYSKGLIKGTGNVKLLKNNVEVDAAFFEGYPDSNTFIFKQRPSVLIKKE